MHILKYIIILGLLFTNNSLVSSKTILRMASGEWPPFQSEKLENGGPITEIIREAFKMGGVEIKIDYHLWIRSFELAKSGDYDGTFIWIRSKEREKFFIYSDPIIDAIDVFFHLKSFSFDWTKFGDLRGLTIGGTLGYDYGKHFQAAEKSGIIKVKRSNTDEVNFKNLLAGRIQIFPMDLIAGQSMLKLKFSEGQRELFTYHPKHIKRVPYHLLLSKKIKKNKEIMKIFNQGINTMKKNGRLEYYLNKVSKN